MSLLREALKLINVILFFFKMVAKALFNSDQDAKNFLTKIYLTYLQNRSLVPSIVLTSDDNVEMSLSSLLLNDEQLNNMERFTYQTALELYSILYLVKTSKPLIIFEFGLMKGGSLYHFIKNTTENVQIISLDITDEFLEPTTKKLIADNKRILFFKADSKKFDFSSYLKRVDFIFVDGGHDYETVKSDSLNAFKMLSDKGTIVWDDYNPAFAGVYRTINELYRDGKNLRHIKGTSLVVYSGL